jgi:hypothetical protein
VRAAVLPQDGPAGGHSASPQAGEDTRDRASLQVRLKSIHATELVYCIEQAEEYTNECASLKVRLKSIHATG